MLEVYSNMQTVNSGETIPFNVTSIQKGSTATHYGPSTIQLNKCGVYAVTLDGYGAGAVGGTIEIQLRKDNILQPQAKTSVTAMNTTSFYDFGFTTLVQVDKNNNNCCCSSPVSLEFVVSGVGLVDAHFNVTVTKIC